MPQRAKRSSKNKLELSPAQADALAFLEHWREKTPLLHLNVSGSRGRTTVLREFQKRHGGHWIDVRDFIEEVRSADPCAVEEAAYHVVVTALKRHQVVLVDDFQLFYEFAGCQGYWRGEFARPVTAAMKLALEQSGGRLIVVSDGRLPQSLDDIAWNTGIRGFEATDYQHLFERIVGRPLAQVNFEEVRRFATGLDCHRIVYISRLIRASEELNTDEFLQILSRYGMSSNVDVEEVQDVRLEDLCGIDDVRTALEDYIVMPLENHELAKRYGLTPKRGVMLAGPPGTGKTTVGRALARRLRGKFFLIDGTVISGTDRFYYQVDSIFAQAVANAPSIVFIDDSDVIFDSGREHGLYRYLLTKLDGLQSESASGVCVMMTAMELGNIPPALIRSGRIELWLETRLPDAASRRRLIEKLFADNAAIDDESAAWADLVERTSGFSGADVKRLVQDAKLKLAVDITRERTVRPFSEYLLLATDEIRRSREQYAKAAAKAAQVNADRPRWFNVHPELFETSGENGDRG